MVSGWLWASRNDFTITVWKNIFSLIDNSPYAFFLFFVTGERNGRFETFSFQHAEPESHSSFAAMTNVSAMSRPTHSTSSQVNQKCITVLTEISTESCANQYSKNTCLLHLI